MQPPDPETPITPSASKPRREMHPSLLSPSSSRCPFPATSTAADGDHGGAVSEHACITLLEWWLANVEGDDQKIAVAGIYENERYKTVMQLAPSPIAKRHDACVVETEDGLVLFIHGSLNLSRMRENGYSSTVCEQFITGFPHWWESCNQLYPKETNCTGNTEKDSKQFYLEQYQLGQRFMSEFTKIVKRKKPCKDAAFQKSSHFSNGASRFEEYTCDGISTDENATASNDAGERHETVCNKVDDSERYLTAGRALSERDGGDIKTNASLVLTVECNDNGNEEADSAPPTTTCDQRTPVIPLKSQGCLRKSPCVALHKKEAVAEDMPTSLCLDGQNSSYMSNGTPRFEEYTCDCDIATDEKAACEGERDEAVCNAVNNVQIDLTAGRALRDDGDIETNASLASTVECANDAGNEKADNALPTSDQGTPVVSWNIKGCQEKNRQIALSEKVAVDEEIPTNEDAAALNDNSERCIAVPEEVDSVERGHDDITTNVYLDPTAECTIDAVNEGVDNTSLLGCKKTPVGSLKSQSCQKKHLQIPSNEKPSAPKKQRSEPKKLQGRTRSPLTSPVPFAHVSRPTRGSVTSLSMSTPEALKLKKTRSGRVTVPTLDAGCQWIVYDSDGTITGVIGLGSPSPKASDENTYAWRKKRRAQPAAASELKTYPRKKRMV